MGCLVFILRLSDGKGIRRQRSRMSIIPPIHQLQLILLRDRRFYHLPLNLLILTLTLTLFLQLTLRANLLFRPFPAGWTKSPSLERCRREKNEPPHKHVKTTLIRMQRRSAVTKDIRRRLRWQQASFMQICVIITRQGREDMEPSQWRNKSTTPS